MEQKELIERALATKDHEITDLFSTTLKPVGPDKDLFMEMRQPSRDPYATYLIIPTLVSFLLLYFIIWFIIIIQSFASRLFIFSRTANSLLLRMEVIGKPGATRSRPSSSYYSYPCTILLYIKIRIFVNFFELILILVTSRKQELQYSIDALAPYEPVFSLFLFSFLFLLLTLHHLFHQNLSFACCIFRMSMSCL